MVESGTIIPFIPFALGILVIFSSGGNLLYMTVGTALIFISGVAFMKVLK